MEEGIEHIFIKKFANNEFNTSDDAVAIEAPLEIQIQHFGEQEPTAISVTMRTPGDDEELALGFLFTEGLLQDYSQVKAVSYLGDNIVKVYLNEGHQIELQKAERNFYTTSSCGVCGKASIEAIETHSQFKIDSSSTLKRSTLFSLKEKLISEQSLFSLTGGIHAAAIFNHEGDLELAMEDVGRHNALDKVVGYLFKRNSLPVKNKILLLSGRASFELLQKATMSGIEVIVSVGAPSSLAVELAKSNNQTLIGFLKKDTFNVYCGENQII
jgi:FdhD protein